MHLQIDNDDDKYNGNNNYNDENFGLRIKTKLSELPVKTILNKRMKANKFNPGHKERSLASSDHHSCNPWEI